MVSAQIAGNMRIYLKAPSGTTKLVASGTGYWFGPGGSSEGTIANTPEKWNFLPVSADRGQAGYSILVTYQMGTGATMDASDCAFVLPVIVNGTQQYVGNSAHAAGLGNSNFTVDQTWADVAVATGVETPIYEIRAKEGVVFAVGGNRVFASVENNA